jgi:hypothetical protein
MEEMLMMRPKFRSRIPLITGRVMLNSKEIGADHLRPLLMGHAVQHAVS